MARRPKRRPHAARPARRGGFTLIEATLATVIVATGVLALVEAQQAYHVKNDFAVRQSTAFLLANEIRELMANRPLLDPQVPNADPGIDLGENPDDPRTFDDLDDFVTDATFGAEKGRDYGVLYGGTGPINALGLEIPELRRYQQRIKVIQVNPNQLRQNAGFDFAVIKDGTGSTDPSDPRPPEYEIERQPEIYRISVSVEYSADPDAPDAAGRTQTLTTVSWIASAPGRFY